MTKSILSYNNLHSDVCVQGGHRTQLLGGGGVVVVVVAGSSGGCLYLYLL